MSSSNDPPHFSYTLYALDALDAMDDLTPRLRQLTADLDQLEAAVAPLLLDGHQAAAAVRLPLLDRAKLHVLAAYALESTLFGSLGLAGVDARAHAVFRELLRVRQYMQKIDTAATPPTAAAATPARRLDTAAAIRFVRAEMDSPTVRAELGALAKKEEETAKTTATTTTPDQSKHARRGRKRGGAAAGGERGSSLAKRPKKGRS